MYLPPHFAETRPRELYRIIREHPLGMLVTHSERGIDANHLPFEFGLTREHEATEPKPWKMGDAPKDYMDEMVSKVVGIEIEIIRLEGKRKLSQNREARDIENAVNELQRRQQQGLASSMSEAMSSRDVTSR